jgi:hypothetical protein
MLRALALTLVLAFLAPGVAAQSRSDCPKGQNLSPHGECKPERKVKPKPVQKDPAERERLRREQEESERNRLRQQER